MRILVFVILFGDLSRNLPRCGEKRRIGDVSRERLFTPVVSPTSRPSCFARVVYLEAGTALVVAAGRARGADDDHASALAAGGGSGHFGCREMLLFGVSGDLWCGLLCSRLERFSSVGFLLSKVMGGKRKTDEVWQTREENL